MSLSALESTIYLVIFPGMSTSQHHRALVVSVAWTLLLLFLGSVVPCHGIESRLSRLAHLLRLDDSYHGRRDLLGASA